MAGAGGNDKKRTQTLLLESSGAVGTDRETEFSSQRQGETSPVPDSFLSMMPL